LGVRVAYHMYEPLSIEFDIVGASSGEARFTDEQYNGQQGDLLRSAKLGRVSLGGVLRLTRSRTARYVPVARLGLGLQGASHTAELEVDGVRMAGPEVEFEISGFWSLGTGLDIRLGDHFLAGFTASYAQTIGSQTRSLEAGIHLGYSWNP
jgi:hypothetical protein